MTRFRLRAPALSAWVSTFSANLLIVLCGITTGVLTARLLHAEGRGALAAIILWPQLLADVGLLCVHEPLTQRISSGAGEEQQTVSTALVLGVGLSLVASMLGVLLIPTLL